METSFQVEKEKLLGEKSSPSSPAWNPRPLYFISPSLLRMVFVYVERRGFHGKINRYYLFPAIFSCNLYVE